MLENNSNDLKKAILTKLLSTTFNDKLNVLESNTSNYFSLMNTSHNLINQVTNTCKYIERKVQENLQIKNKKLQTSPNKQKINSINRNYSIGLISKNSIKVSKNLIKSIKSPLINTEMKKSKSNINLLKGRQSARLNSVKNPFKKSDNKLAMSLKLSNNNINQLKRSKTERDFRQNKKNKGNKKFQNNKNYDKNKSIDNSTITNIKTKDIQSKTFDDHNNNESKIFEIENGLILNDPLLVGNNEIDFIQKGLLINSNDIEVIYHTLNFKILDFAEDQLPFILKYLQIKDYLNLKLICKTFRNIVNEIILSELENQKIEYERKINLFKAEEILSPYNPNNITLTKGALKAVNLLNQALLNKLFTQSAIPSDDILLIYHIYFQLINHPLTKEFNDKQIFWKKCCYYFNNESNGKTGELLLKNLKDGIDLKSDNIYKLIQIMNGHIQKITPAYFSKICGTTGLFVFFIKDILDFLGISNDKKLQSNSYWTYKGVINVIDKKIAKIKTFSNHN